ncbi:Uncharacterized protein dnm_076310 [Desulfonema magnum]|uniref:Uncharacterized protein n=1 Tax=Desulfonema magnum TaxID=45655 RepID=A0A975BTT5_9BACT|nr:Uncharacterized protein dnm_076310 [Desulfonema magnum]
MAFCSFASSHVTLSVDRKIFGTKGVQKFRVRFIFALPVLLSKTIC